MKRSLVMGFVVAVVAVVAFFIGRNTRLEQPRFENFPGVEKHEVNLSDAIKYVQNYRKNPQPITIQGGSFQRGILDKILSQPDCDGIRFFYAQNDDGTPTMVLIGITAKGNELSTGTVAEKIMPCPPWCDAASQFN